MVNRPPPEPIPSRRDRRRNETIADIKTAARAQLAEGGPTGISLRAIARQLGMAPSAVHYYFPGRQALLDAIIVDGWDSLATAALGMPQPSNAEVLASVRAATKQRPCHGQRQPECWRPERAAHRGDRRHTRVRARAGYS